MRLPPNAGGDFTPPPSGTHAAICYRVVDLGTQQIEWQGSVKHQRKIMVSWELPDEKMEDGQPFSVHQRYTLSSSDKATLRKHLEAWRGRAFQDSDFDPKNPAAFDIKNLLGVPCLLTVLHATKEGKTYANIAAVSKLPKGMPVLSLTSAKVYFSLDEFNQQTFADLSDDIKGVIMKSPEYAEIVNRNRGPGHVSDDPGPASDDYGSPDMNDDIPF